MYFIFFKLLTTRANHGHNHGYTMNHRSNLYGNQLTKNEYVKLPSWY